MAQRILILTEQNYNDLTEMLDYILDFEMESFFEAVDSGTVEKLDDVSKTDFDATLEAYLENPGNDNDLIDNLAVLSRNHVFCNAVRLWRKLNK